MIDRVEEAVVARLEQVAPRADYGLRMQYAEMLPILALLRAGLAILLGGWLFQIARLFIAPEVLGYFLLSPGFWLFLLPPLLYILSFQPLRARQLLGWRLFVVASVLSFFGALLSFALIGLLFDLALLYFGVQTYREFRY